MHPIRPTLLLFFLTAPVTMAPALTFNVPLASLTNHNTSAYPAYNQRNFPANFIPAISDVDTKLDTIPTAPDRTDRSLNPVTPGHVSRMDVHVLIPSRPDLRWFAHATPWFSNGTAGIEIGLTNDSFTYVTNMITDMENRGFDGVVINWYGKGDITDNVTLKVKQVLAGNPTNHFHYILMLDKGVHGKLKIPNLTRQIYYCQTNYFNDPNYEKEPVTNGNPVLMFFGVAWRLGNSNMLYLKTNNEAMGHDTMVWVEQGTDYLDQSWEDESFLWTDNFHKGTPPPAGDPFNTNKVVSEYDTIKNSGKKAFAAMCSQFNGTLTKSIGWSMGKYLPSSNGLCLVERAAVMNANLNSNFTRMQWATWSDWEEGTQVETGIENNVQVAGSVDSSGVLSWSITHGEPRAVHHFEVYAATNGSPTAALLVSTASNNVFQIDLSHLALPPATYSIYVDALGLPCVRDHLSPAIPFRKLP